MMNEVHGKFRVRNLMSVGFREVISDDFIDNDHIVIESGGFDGWLIGYAVIVKWKIRR